MIRCLPSGARRRLGDADRLDDLLELAARGQLGDRRAVVGEQALPHELLGDRRGAARPAADRVDAGGDDADRVEARVVPEARVLDRRRRVDETGGMSLNSTTSRLNSPNRASSTLCSRSQTIGLLGELDRLELLRVREALAELAVRRRRRHRPHDAEDEERGEQERGPSWPRRPCPCGAGARVCSESRRRSLRGSLPFGCGSGHGTTLATIAPSLACIPCPDARRCRFLIEP